MKAVELGCMPDLDALVTKLYQDDEGEPISLERKGKQIALIISVPEYKALRRLEESLLDKLDVEESDEVLRDPKWLDWDQVQKQLKP